MAENTMILYHSGGVSGDMDFSLQQAVLLVLGALLPAVAFVLARAEYVAVITLVNVVLIWISLRIATGGGLRSDDETALDPTDAGDA